MKNALAKGFPPFPLIGMLLAVLFLVLPCGAEATAPRIAPQLLGEQKKADIVAYEMAPLSTAAQPDRGLAVAIVNEAFNAAGEKVAIDVLPAKSLAKYALVNNNSVAMIGELRDFSEKEKAQIMAEVLHTRISRFFYYKPAHATGLPWQGKLADLKGLAYGGLSGEDQEPYKKAGIRVVEGDVHGLFEKLRNKELDFVGVPDLVGKSWIEKTYPKEAADFAELNPAAWESPMHIMFAKSNPRANLLHGAFVKGLKLIVKNGKYLEILEKYYGKGQAPADFASHLKH